MTNQPDSRGNFLQVKETIESVVIALILAFVFRAFVVEAFVIPTGSMAPTLYGADIDHVCTNCGYHFAIGVGAIPNEVRCPNCDWIDQIAPGSQSPPPVDSGDRILVLKWPYALDGSFSPKRWDVVVFKAPFSSPANVAERDGQTNYIKRLIGLPGDIVQIIDGDVYTCRGSEVADAIRNKLAHTPLPQALTPQEKRDLDSRLRIARKTPQAQDALWQIVYDADYQPARQRTVQWRPLADRSNWRIEGRSARFDAPEAGPEFIELTGKDFRDDCGYNEGGGKRIVSDLQLRVGVDWENGDGSLLLCLSKHDDLYTIEISPRRGIGRALRTGLLSRQGPEVLGTWAFRSWRRNWPVDVSFAHVDRQACKSVSTAPSSGSTPSTAQPPPPPGPGHKGMTPALPWSGSAPAGSGSTSATWPSTATCTTAMTSISARRPRSAGPSAAPTPTSRPGPRVTTRCFYVRMSTLCSATIAPRVYDSRLWWQTGEHLADRPEPYRVGTVPADQMIGEAFFVYWPNGYRVFGYGLPIVPNVGEMRWIR